MSKQVMVPISETTWELAREFVVREGRKPTAELIRAQIRRWMRHGGADRARREIALQELRRRAHARKQ